MQRFWSSILLSTLGRSVTTPERVLSRSALFAGRPVFVLARHRHREHHRCACSAEGPDQQCVAWTRNPDQKPGPETKFGAPETGKSGNAPSGSSSKDIAHDEGPAPVAVAYRRGARMAAHEAYLTHSTILCARSIRAQSTAPHRRSCTASMPAPHGRRALRSKQKMSFEQGALLGREFRLRSARLVVSVTDSPRVSSRCTALNMSSRKICSDKV